MQSGARWVCSNQSSPVSCAQSPTPCAPLNHLLTASTCFSCAVVLRKRLMWHGQAAPDTSSLTASLTIVGSSLTLPSVAVRNEMKADAEVTAGLQHHIIANTTGMPLCLYDQHHTHACLPRRQGCLTAHAPCVLPTPHLCLYCQHHTYASNTCAGESISCLPVKASESPPLHRRRGKASSSLRAQGSSSPALLHLAPPPRSTTPTPSF